jgi:hypothetical protein
MVTAGFLCISRVKSWWFNNLTTQTAASDTTSLPMAHITESAAMLSARQNKNDKKLTPASGFAALASSMG